MYDPKNWYWIVAGDETKVWSSAAAAYVPAADKTYKAWLANPDNLPSRIASEDELRDVLLTAYPAGWPGGALSAKRYAVETGGTTWNGWAVQTDRDSQGKISASYAMARDGHWQGGWKFADGVYRILTADQVIAMALTVAAFVGSCFAHEAALLADPSADMDQGWPS